MTGQIEVRVLREIYHGILVSYCRVIKMQSIFRGQGVTSSERAMAGQLQVSERAANQVKIPVKLWPKTVRKPFK